MGDNSAPLRTALRSFGRPSYYGPRAGQTDEEWENEKKARRLRFMWRMFASRADVILLQSIRHLRDNKAAILAAIGGIRLGQAMGAASSSSTQQLPAAPGTSRLPSVPEASIAPDAASGSPLWGRQRRAEQEQQQYPHAVGAECHSCMRPIPPHQLCQVCVPEAAARGAAALGRQEQGSGSGSSAEWSPGAREDTAEGSSPSSSGRWSDLPRSDGSASGDYELFRWWNGLGPPARPPSPLESRGASSASDGSSGTVSHSEPCSEPSPSVRLEGGAVGSYAVPTSERDA